MIAIGLFLFGVLTSAPVKAQDVFGSACTQANHVPSDWPFENKTDPINYYVHADFAEKFNHCSPVYDASDNIRQHELTGLMKHAAEIWNFSTIGTPYVYRGWSNHYDLDEFCSDDSVQKPAVLVDFRVGCRLQDTYEDLDCFDDCDHHGDGNCDEECSEADACTGALATVNEISECDDAMEVVFMGDPNRPHSCGEAPYRWHLDDASEESELIITDDPTDWDFSLLITAIHELGHVLNLGHTSQSNSVMNSAYTAQWPRRHPSKWDKDCVRADDANNTRTLQTLHQSLPFSGSQWNNIQVHPGATARGHAMDGAFWRGWEEIIYAIMRVDVLPFTNYFFPPSSSGELEFDDSLQILTHPELFFNYHATPSYFSLGYDFKERISYHYHGDHPSNLVYPPTVKAVISTDFFDDVNMDETFHICENQTCTETSPLQSSVPIAHTRDHDSDLDIMVTVTDTDQHLGGQINVHPGMEDGSTIRAGSTVSEENTEFPRPEGYTYFPYRPLTDFKPAVACGKNTLYEYNCLLAWAPRGALNGRIVYTYFRYDSENDAIDWLGEAWGRAGSRTRGHVSAGWFEDKFWIGWKDWVRDHTVKRTHSIEPGCYTCWSDAEAPDNPAPTGIVDPPTFYYPPYSMPVEAGWSWTETYRRR